jgi:hypothetical protein
MRPNTGLLNLGLKDLEKNKFLNFNKRFIWLMALMRPLG